MSYFRVTRCSIFVALKALKGLIFMKNLNSYSVITEGERVVKHEGVVSKITNNVITVTLKGNINCESCHAKGGCGAAESGPKEIEVYNSTESLKLNETVEVLLSKDKGLQAVFWAYVFPFILLISVLLISSSIYKEWIAGLLSIAILVPYYFILYVLRNSFKKAFKVSILKMV